MHLWKDPTTSPINPGVSYLIDQCLRIENVNILYNTFSRNKLKTMQDLAKYDRNEKQINIYLFFLKTLHFHKIKNFQ